MSYIGRQLNNLSDRVKLDSITASATATYNLLLNGVAYVPSSAESLTVSLNGVIQAPQDSYTVSGSTITFSSTLSAQDSIDFILAERSITLQTPSAGSVGLTQLSATGTKDATTFLRGDNTFASAGLSGWSENGANNDLLPSNASAGIYLGVNSATATNLLNDYEEGTFTPNWSVSGGNASHSADPTTNVGVYMKIGKFVHLQIYTNQISSSGTSGVYTVNNLPFTCHSTAGAGGGGREYGQTGYSIAVWIDPNSTTMKISKYDATFIANAYHILSATYRIS